jgi:molecular chaperone DnaK
MPSSEFPPAVGIDLGTTNSVLASVDEFGRAYTVRNAQGGILTPTAVYIDGQEVVVGEEALKAGEANPANLVIGAKRETGSRCFSRQLLGLSYPVEVLQAYVLNRLRLDASRQLGEFSKVVITVPAYFDESRRKATEDAGLIAGLEVVDIINEPIAAAIAYGLNSTRGQRSVSTFTDRYRLVVYDLGGGTFDVTVMDIRGTDFVTLSTDGDLHLGGYDWDQRLVNYVAEEYIRRYSLDPREDPFMHWRLRRECEAAKRTLSVRSATTVSLDCGGDMKTLQISRDMFEDMTRDLLFRTGFAVTQALQAARTDWSEVDRILVVGGSSRMPAVERLLHDMSGKEIDRAELPDEAIANGAALHASALTCTENGQQATFRIRNVNSHSLGVLAGDPVANEPRNVTVIPRNTPLPVTRLKRFVTRLADQRSILITIVEGEAPSPDDCIQIGQLSIVGLPPDLPLGTPVYVTFHYRHNGRLKVSVEIKGLDSKAKFTLHRENRLSLKQILRWRQLVSGVPALGIS